MKDMAPLLALELRASLKEAVRSFFGTHGFLEIDTPIAVPCPGTEVHLRYFPTAWRDIHGAEHSLYLRSSPELHMKQALALGAQRVYQIGACFRSGGEVAEWHHPEFAMLEWYETGLSFTGLIDQTEALLRATHARVAPLVTARGGSPVALPKAFTRLSVAEAFQRFAGLELIDGDAELGAKAARKGLQSPQPGDDFETAFFKVLLDRVEPGLAALAGAVLYDYPASQSALALVDGKIAKRVEFYVRGIELSNGFAELLDPAENRRRYQDASAKRRALGYEVPPEDPAFAAALAKGLPACSGNALGFDRWLGLLMGSPNLDTVLPFRRMRPYYT
jgi:lysyl-tRNA synthetase class 2